MCLSMDRLDVWHSDIDQCVACILFLHNVNNIGYADVTFSSI
jgi:hypothetical protein